MSEWRPVWFPYGRGSERSWGVYRPGPGGGWLTGTHGQFLMFTKAGAHRRTDDLNARPALPVERAAGTEKTT